jgi:hypothetical protein
MRKKLHAPWVKERVLQGEFFGSNIRLYFRLRADGSIFMTKLSDYGHTLSFKYQQETVRRAFRVFAKEPSDSERFTVSEFDRDFEEMLRPGFRLDGGINIEVLGCLLEESSQREQEAY